MSWEDERQEKESCAKSISQECRLASGGWSVAEMGGVTMLRSLLPCHPLSCFLDSQGPHYPIFPLHLSASTPGLEFSLSSSSSGSTHGEPSHSISINRTCTAKVEGSPGWDPLQHSHVLGTERNPIKGCGYSPLTCGLQASCPRYRANPQEASPPAPDRTGLLCSTEATLPALPEVKEGKVEATLESWTSSKAMATAVGYAGTPCLGWPLTIAL